jgi:magnesium-protoporphyrin O-methyltransferase
MSAQFSTATYQQRRGQLLEYFDRTAADAWKRLTSDAPVNRIRATVRAGRAEMRGTLLGWLPTDLRGQRILDAGCGTGVLAMELARCGAAVTAIDLSPNLIAHARDSLRDTGAGTVEFRVGDMLDPALGGFDTIIAMDSLIHYRADDIAAALIALAARARRSLLFTYAPRTAALTAMHALGRLFPRNERAPAIEPIASRTVANMIIAEPGLAAWRCGRSRRTATGFYISQAQELVPV